MKILKVDANKPDINVIKEAVNVLKLGGILVYPTDTCYGLGADATNTIALNKIYKIKGRDINKPIAMIVKNITQIIKLTEVDNHKKKFIKSHLPGAVTFILMNINFKMFNYNTIGIRIPDYKLTRLISKKINFPYTTTSANLSGQNVCYNIKDVIGQFKKQKVKPDLLLDAGQLPPNLPSTVIDLTSWPPKLFRQGSAKIKLPIK